MLFRVFPFVKDASITEAGGALFVHRGVQGTGRHDSPDLYSALYATRDPESAIAEGLKAFGGTGVSARDFGRADGATLALATFDDEALGPLVDFDDARTLLQRRLRPSQVATRRRKDTQEIAVAVYREGGPGLSWWSTIESSWTNVTLFADRASPKLVLHEQPRPLSIDDDAVRAAAEVLSIRLARR